MERVYMVCDYTDSKASSIDSAPNIGVEHMGNCGGRILREDGSEIGGHHSSSFGWLRADLRSKLDDPSKYEVVDLIGHPVPERFKRTSQSAAPKKGEQP
jgi:hypothetical protein